MSGDRNVSRSHHIFTLSLVVHFRKETPVSFENNYDQLITFRVFSDSLNSCRLIYSQFPLLYTSSLIRVMLFTSQIMLISWGKTIFSSAIRKDSLLYWHWSFRYSTTWLTEGNDESSFCQEFASFVSSPFCKRWSVTKRRLQVLQLLTSSLKNSQYSCRRTSGAIKL